MRETNALNLEADYFRTVRWAAAAMVLAGVGKCFLRTPSWTLAVGGFCYFVLLWRAMQTGEGHGPKIAAGLATVALFVCLWASGDDAMIALGPLVPTVAVVAGLQWSVALVVALAFATTALNWRAGGGQVGIGETFLSVSGSGVFLLEFSRLLIRERQQARANVLHAERFAELATRIERQRLSQAMHDGVGHYLSAAVVQLEAARLSRTVDPARADASTARASELVLSGMAEVRRAVGAMREHSVPLAVALAELIEVSNEAGIDTSLASEGAARSLPPDVAWTIFSTLQESLTNVRKHARASRVTVTLRHLPASTELEIADDGIGPRGIVHEGNGLRGMRERAAMLGGDLVFSAATAGGAGFRLVLGVPE
jgi:signal transduction histidine kinase